MKIYLVGVAKEYGFNIQEFVYHNLEEATKSFEKYKDFYFRAIVEVDHSKKKPKRKLIKKIIGGKEVK